MISFRARHWLAILIIFHNPFIQALAADSTSDSLSIAARLIRSGDLIQAEEVLNQLPESEQNQDSYFVVTGLLKLYQLDYSLAEWNFQEAQRRGSSDRYVDIYLAQSQFGQDRYSDTLKTLSAVLDLAESIPSMYVMRSLSHWRLANIHDAWTTVREGLKKFPREFRLHQLVVEWFLELNLYESATSYLWQIFEGRSIDLDTFVRMLGTLRNHKLYPELATLLEAARMAASSIESHEKISILLAHTYLQMDQAINAAEIFENLVRINPSYAFEAGEIWISLKNWTRAERMNSLVFDQEKKIKQRFAIYISQGDFVKASAMEADLSRFGLVANEDLRYALAYSYFQLGSFSEMNRHLNGIQRTDLFQKATALRKEVYRCQSNSSNAICGG